MQHPIDPAIDFNSIRDAIESMLVGRDQLVDDRDMQNILIAILEYSRQQRAVCQNPYINNATNTWYVYDSNGNPYDTNVSAEGTIIRQTEAQSIEGDPRVTLTQIDPMKPNEMKMTIYIPKGERGESGSIVTIVDGYWYIDGVNTGVVATGEAPTISEDGYWVVGGEKTEFKAVGTDGRDGVDGQNGADGYSPTATVVKTGNTATIEITDKNGTTTATISDGAAPNVQSDWNQSNASADDYIKNKPTLSTVATSGSYNDLTNKPSKSVYSDTIDLININNWPSIHTIEMGRKAAFAYYSGDAVAPTVVLQYGSPIATGKQEWDGSSGDYIKYVPLSENKEYVLEFTVTSFDFDEDGQYTEDNDISCIFYVKAETGADGYLLNAPQMMKSHINDNRVFPISGVVGTAPWNPSAYVTFYPNKKVGTVTLGSNTFDVMTYNSGFEANNVRQANGEYWLDGIQLYANINGQKESLGFTGTGHPVTIDDNGEGILNDTGWHLIHLGTSYPAVITQGVTVGRMGVIGWETRNVSFKDNLPNGIGHIADDTSDNIAYNREGYDIVIGVEDLSTAIDDIETTYNDGGNKIMLFSAPEDDGGEQKRLVVALTRASNDGIYGVDVSVAIRALKSESKYRTYRASDYDHIVYPD